MISKDEYKKALNLIEDYEIQQEEIRKKLNSNPDCALNRLPKNCSIIQNTSFNTCNGCGHNNKERVFYKPKKDEL